MNSPGRPRLDDLRGAVLCAALLIGPLVYSDAFFTYTHLKEAVLCICFSLAALLLLAAGRFTWNGARAFAPLWLWIALVAVVHLVVGRAAVPADAAATLARYALALLGGALAFDLLREDKWRLRLTVVYLISALLVGLAGLLQFAGIAPFLFPAEGPGALPMSALFGNTDLFGGYLAPAAALAALLLIRACSGRLAMVWAALLTFIWGMLFLSGCRSAWIAGMAGMLAAVAFSWDKPNLRRRTLGLAGVLALALVTALLADGSRITDRAVSAVRMESIGVRARLWFWDGAARMIADRPLLGSGPGQFAYHSPRYLGEALHAPGGDRHFHNTVHTIHTHATPLDLLVEGGLAGALLIGWMLMRLSRRRGPEWVPLAAWGVFALFNFPHAIAPHAWLAVLFMASLLARPHSDEPAGSPRRSSMALPVAVLCLSAYVLYTGPFMGYCLRRADRLQLTGDPTAPLAYERVLRMPLTPAVASRNHAIALMGAGRYADAEAAFRRSLAGLDTADIHLALGWRAKRRGDNASAREHLDACLFRTPGETRAYALLLDIVPPEDREEVLKRAEVWLTPDEYGLLVE